MKKLISILMLCLLTSCMTPTMRLPSTTHLDVVKLRRQMLLDSIYKEIEVDKRAQTLFYNIKKSTGEDLCDKKLTPDLGIVYSMIQRFGIWWLASTEEKEKYEDYLKIYKHPENELFVSYVIKGSAADKAGIKSGDVISSIYGQKPPTGKTIAADILDILEENQIEGLGVDIDIIRDGELISLNFEPDMLCNYPLYVDTTDTVVNAYATGDEVYVTQGMMDKLTDDTLLSVVLAHELSHNVLGHVESSQINMIGAMFLSSLSDIFLGTNIANETTHYASVAYSKDFEHEADTLGTYFVARAGLDYHRAKEMPAFLASLNYRSLYVDGDTHPRPQYRYAVISEAINEIELKQAFDEPLEPDFKKKNIFLKGKK
ncbi:MAG: M48 family metallopeptidase [Alphaproteobacteria bacterium]